MRLIMVLGGLVLLAGSGSALAQNSAAGPSVAFGEVTGIPIPLQSVSGRFSSLNPLGRSSCSDKKVSGRVISPTLVLVPEGACGRRGQVYVLVNVELSNPADKAQMVPGRKVDITGNFKRAFEDRRPYFTADFVIAENAAIAGGDPVGAPPAAPFTSYMVCQPPELDEMATKIGSDLCVQNTLVADVAARPALEAAARVPSKEAPEDVVSGDPNAITCGQDHEVSDEHLTDIACARNSYWSWYKALRDPKFSQVAPP